MIHRSNFFKNYGQFLSKYPDTDMTDLFSKGQMNSKSWLVDCLLDLDRPLGTVFLCAGWYGSLATFIFESGLSVDKIRSFDIDEPCADKADTFNRSWTIDGWKFKASTMDILEMSYPTHYITHKGDGTFQEMDDTPDTIINTSCEHLLEFAIWYDNIPTGTTVVLQSNNFFEIEEHVNCSVTLEDFSSITPMTTELYSGESEMPKYTRFMRIGIK
jgi:hypothetical protein